MISKPTALDGTWKASELRKLPASERDAILMEAAEQAEREYLTNFQLTDDQFAAFEAELNKPPAEDPILRKLLGTPAPWE